MTSWQRFEAHVRILATAKWNVPATPENINGVKCDCVLKLRPDYWVIVELTEENSLEKRRSDLSKFNMIKPFLLSKNIFSECYMVIKDLEAESSLRRSGDGLNVKVLNQHDFCNIFLDYKAYSFNRGKKNFGSAVNIDSGENDTSKYVEVKYQNLDNEEEYSIREIVEALYKNKKIILTGDYGTGKSRCIKELFNILAEKSDISFVYPLAINLREYWGLQTKEEIINRHFYNLGLSNFTSTILKIINDRAIILLLDGFDEISSQSWSDDPVKLIEIRKKALMGVRDLVSSSRGGLIITGRDYYFNSTSELFQALGTPPAETITLKCANEFSESEVEKYLSEKTKKHTMPYWLPKKPLMVQVFSQFDDHQCEILLNSDNEIQLSQFFIDQICERESKISNLLDKDTIKNILIALARLTRTKADNYGPISVEEINSAFENITGNKPVDESAVMLQRLPGLARFEAESRDRKFIDLFMLDPLRSEDLLQTIMQEDSSVMLEPWKNPLENIGIDILSKEIKVYSQFVFRELKRQNERFVNTVFPADVFHALLEAFDELDMHDITLNNVKLNTISFENVNISNLTIRNSIIDELYLSDKKPNNVVIDNCIIMKLNGCSGKGNMPNWISSNCQIGIFSEMNTLSKIKKANISEEEQLFIATIKRLFCQPGKGRKEQALLKGFGNISDIKTIEKIIKLLLREHIISSIPGKDGSVYTPNRKHAARINNIINTFLICNDPLYLEVKSWANQKK